MLSQRLQLYVNTKLEIQILFVNRGAYMYQKLKGTCTKTCKNISIPWRVTDLIKLHSFCVSNLEEWKNSKLTNLLSTTNDLVSHVLYELYMWDINCFDSFTTLIL